MSGATTSQEFASKGATYAGGDRSSPLTADADQLKLRYDAASKTYEIRLPAGTSWLPISATDDAGSWATADSSVTLGATKGDSTSIVRWSGGGSFGVTAVAIPTPLSAIPTTGSAHYLGAIAGYSSELVPYNDTRIAGRISGTINLTFDFGAGALSGTIEPLLSGRLSPHWTLPMLAFKETVYSVGSPTFSGKFDTNVSGLNSFSGLFAGPAAGEVAGNFAFPYLSPQNGTAQQASGAFTAHQ